MKIFLTLLLLKFTLILNAQNYKAEYNLSYLINPDTIIKISDKIRFRNYLEDLSNQTVILNFNSHNSSFKTEHIKHPASKLLTAFQNTFVDTNKKCIYFQNRKKHSYYPKEYSYRNLTEYNWQISKEIKIISGYTCYKANGSLKQLNNEYLGLEVWFCPDFPFPFGPNIYTGLPGLVFEAYQANGLEFHFTLKSIKKDTESFEMPNILENNIEHKLILLERLKNIAADLKKQYKK